MPTNSRPLLLAIASMPLVAAPAMATTIDRSALDARLVPDGTALVVDGADAAVRRDVADGRVLARFEATAAPLTWFGTRGIAALQANARGVVVLTGDGAIGAWDLDGRPRWWSHEGSRDVGEAAWLAADGRMVAVAGGWDGWVEARDAADGHLLRRWQEGDLVFGVVAGPGARMVAWIGLKEIVRLGDVATGAVRDLGPGRWPMAIAPDGRTVVAMSAEPASASGRPARRSRLVAIDVATGARRDLPFAGRPLRGLEDGRLLVATRDDEGRAIGLARGLGLTTSYLGTSYLVGLADGRVRQRWTPAWPVSPPLISWSSSGSPLPFFLALLAFVGTWFGLGRREVCLRRRLKARRPGAERLRLADAYVWTPLVATVAAMAWGLRSFAPLAAAMVTWGFPLALLATLMLGNACLARRLRVLDASGPDHAQGPQPGLE